MHLLNAGFTRSRRALAVLLMTVVAAACGDGKPSTETARATLRAAIDSGNESRLHLVSFTRTDGRASEMMGVKGYEILFTADAEFVTNALFVSGNMFNSEADHISTSEYRPASNGFSWADFGTASQGGRRARKGDRLHLHGTVLFEHRESGWAPAGVQVSVTHDSSTRDQAAVENERVQKQAAAAAQRKTEEDRLEMTRARQAAEDAAASRTQFMITGPTAYGRETGEYYIGALTGKDVLLIEPVAGILHEIVLYNSNDYYPKDFAHGRHLDIGEFGGSGRTFSVAGVVRAEMPDIGEARVHVWVELRGEGNVTVKMTILCHPMPGKPCMDR